MKRKILVCVLVLTMCLGFIPFSSYAEETDNATNNGDPVATVTIGGESEEYINLDDAIVKANAAEGKERVTVTIVKDGEYKGFKLTRPNITIEASEGVDAVIVKSDKAYALNSAVEVNKNADGAEFKNLEFNAKDFTNWGFVVADGHTEFDSCRFVGHEKAETAILNSAYKKANGHKTIVKNCEFSNFKEGMHDMGDGSQMVKLSFENCVFNNVIKCINAYADVPYKGDEPNFVVKGNTFNAPANGTSIVGFYDHAQFYNYFGNPDREGSSINVLMEGNTYNGDVEIFAHSFNVSTETPIKVDAKTEEHLIYTSFVELEGIADATLLNADGSEITGEGFATDVKELNGRKYMKAIPEGNYIISAKADENSNAISLPLEIKKPTVGTTNKVVLKEENKYVASVGETKYSSIHEAIKNMQSGDTLTLLNDIVVTQGMYFDNDLKDLSNITINGNGHTVRADQKFKLNEYGQNNLMKFNNISGVTLKDITLVSSKTSKHVLDVYGSTDVILQNVTLNHANAEKGAPLINNGSKIILKGKLDFVTGDNSWYAIGIDNKNSEASLKFEKGSSLTHVMSKEVPTIFKEETEGQPPVVIEGTENVGLEESADGIYTVHKHTNVKHIAKKEATCTEDGNVEYWYCEDCDKYFSDKELTKAITKEETVIKATGHKYDDRGKCTVCGVLTPDAEEANKVDALIDAIGPADQVTLDSYDKIMAAKNAYEALTDEQKKLVTGVDDLNVAIDVYNKLKDEEEITKPVAPNEEVNDNKDSDNDKDKDQKEESDSVKTGDDMAVGLLAGMLLLSGAGFVALRRKEK